jgi:pimeloyl-ACP methyl ester carboxylesterase
LTVAPTLVTFGRWDLVTSTRFESALWTISDVEVRVFEDRTHAAIYEIVAAFNERTLAFLRSRRG